MKKLIGDIINAFLDIYIGDPATWYGKKYEFYILQEGGRSSAPPTLDVLFLHILTVTPMATPRYLL